VNFDRTVNLMDRNIRVLASGEALVNGVTEWMVSRLQGAIERGGRATIALAGGNTPKAVYRAIAAADLPWEQLYIFWGDERYVPPTDPASNEGMVRENWLDRVAVPAANIFPWPTQVGSPEQCADRYAQTVGEFFGLGPGEHPRFDLVLLGMGDDGHTASLFPHDRALQAPGLTAVGAKGGEPRLTLTASTINGADCVAFLIAGAAKQPALQQVWAEVGDDQLYPARQIRPGGELWWWLDEAAAIQENKG
jgi:6-phosphogluconolactonase